MSFTNEVNLKSRMWVALQELSRSEPLTRMAEHACRLWVALACMSRLELLTRMTEHASRLWVSLVFLQMRTTDENGWTCIQRVSHSSVFECIRITDDRMDDAFSLWVALQHVSRSEPLTGTVNIHLACELLSLLLVFESNWMRIGDHPSSLWVALSNVWADQNHWWEWWTWIQPVSCSPIFESWSESLTRMGEHTSSLWVALQSLNWLEPLMRMGEN